VRGVVLVFRSASAPKKIYIKTKAMRFYSNRHFICLFAKSFGALCNLTGDHRMTRRAVGEGRDAIRTPIDIGRTWRWQAASERTHPAAASMSLQFQRQAGGAAGLGAMHEGAGAVASGGERGAGGHP
jgi:hypothetical protein